MPTEDAAYLRAFEELVQSQQPASGPWQPVTDYSFEARRQVEEPHAKLIKEVFEVESVLDVGCGPGHLVRLLRDLDVVALGWDRQPPKHLPLVLRRVITQRDICSRVDWDEGTWPLVICREVLEHLTIKQIAQAVRNLCALSSRFVYVTTRFHPKPCHLLDVATADDLDPTHITMLDQNFLRTLLVLEGFTRRADLEQRMDWQHKGRVLVYERPHGS